MNKIWKWLIALFYRHSEAPNQNAPASTESKAAPHGQAVPKTATKDDGDGVWRFKRHVLDRLDKYFETVAVLRQKEPGVYAEFAQIGAAVSADGVSLPSLKTKAVLATADIHAISFGAVAPFLSMKDQDGRVHLRLVTFERLDRLSPGVQPTNGTAFRMVAIYMMDDDRPYCGEFYVSVSEDGTVAPLKMLAVASQSIRHKKKTWRGNTSTVYHLQWQLPRFLSSFKDEHPNAEISDIATGLFLWAYTAYKNAQGGARVRIEKGGLVASIAVDLLRIPSFFSDREKVTVNGRTEKIFHIVRTHARETNGKTSYVKSHFRGARRFVWKSYSVNITMPGYHHAPVYGMNFTSGEYAGGETQPANMIDKREVVARVGDALNR